MIDHEPTEFNNWRLQWVKEYCDKLDEEQEEIDNNPNSKTLYTYEIDVDTLEIESYTIKVLDYDEECVGYASYEESLDGNRVYAESLCSTKDARRLVEQFCLRFAKAASKIEQDIFYHG